MTQSSPHMITNLPIPLGLGVSSLNAATHNCIFYIFTFLTSLRSLRLPTPFYSFFLFLFSPCSLQPASLLLLVLDLKLQEFSLSVSSIPLGILFLMSPSPSVSSELVTTISRDSGMSIMLTTLLESLESPSFASLQIS